MSPSPCRPAKRSRRATQHAGRAARQRAMPTTPRLSVADGHGDLSRQGRLVVRRSIAAACCLVGSAAQAKAIDTVADVMAWIVLIIVPVVVIALFWIVHVMPEKIAEKRGHPQAAAIKMLCLLSLVFGGMLWPLAWLWAYSKPVLYKMAYGVDRVDHHAEEAASVHEEPTEAGLHEPPELGVQEEHTATTDTVERAR